MTHNMRQEAEDILKVANSMPAPSKMWQVYAVLSRTYLNIRTKVAPIRVRLYFLAFGFLPEWYMEEIENGS